MTHVMKRTRDSSRSGRRRFCRGLSTLDLLVALTLLVAAMSVVTPLLVRYGRVVSSHRHYRLALDELSNQLERLRAMPAHDVPSAIERLTLSSFTEERLPGAELKGQLRPEAGGSRVKLSLSWNEGERHRAPVSLAAWVFPAAPAENVSTGGGLQ